MVVETNEEPQVVRMTRQIGKRLQLKTYRWTVTEGLQAFEPCDQPMRSLVKSQDILSYIKTESKYCLFLLLDYHPYLEDPLHVRRLKDIALTYDKHYSTVLIVGPALKIPRELEPYVATFHLPLPTPEQLRAMVLDVAAEWGAQNGNRSVETTNKELDLLVRNLVGLTATDARRLAFQAINDNGIINEADIPEIMRAKYELLGRDASLSFENETVRFADVGGMHRLRQWLLVRKEFFNGTQTHLDPPRGVLLLGVQGCGKSLVAKASAGILGVPLLRLDFGSLYNKYYGETERNLRRALETAELMSPCVLWMDEIEKGLSTDRDDDGLSRRILGTLLTWLSEHKKPVFIVATANDISILPPEMVRKGRFDEIFFVDLPSPENRETIFSIHLKKRGFNPDNFNLEELAAAASGFSGSEIEQVIVSAMYVASAARTDMNQADLLNEIKQTRPLSVVMAEKINELRRWAESRTVPCD
ncbi:MAG TPA: AAA family ATPase [Candidatus Binatia bacterium]|nr:AAA family ATPase [Candidatus Binatia bacterium]